MDTYKFDLRNSKLYELARSTTLYPELTPDIATQMAVEISAAEEFARDEEDGDDTRILINYINLKGNSMVCKMLHKTRMGCNLDIDDFLNNYNEYLGEGSELPDDPIEQFRYLTMAALTFAVSAALGLDSAIKQGMGEALARQFLGAAISAIYDDPLDVVINVADRTIEVEGGSPEIITTITWMWRVKQRTEVE